MHSTVQEFAQTQLVPDDGKHSLVLAVLARSTGFFVAIIGGG